MDNLAYNMGYRQGLLRKRAAVSASYLDRAKEMYWKPVSKALDWQKELQTRWNPLVGAAGTTVARTIYPWSRGPGAGQTVRQDGPAAKRLAAVDPERAAAGQAAIQQAEAAARSRLGARDKVRLGWERSWNASNPYYRPSGRMQQYGKSVAEEARRQAPWLGATDYMKNIGAAGQQAMGQGGTGVLASPEAALQARRVGSIAQNTPFAGLGFKAGPWLRGLASMLPMAPAFLSSLLQGGNWQAARQAAQQARQQSANSFGTGWASSPEWYGGWRNG